MFEKRQSYPLFFTESPPAKRVRRRRARRKSDRKSRDRSRARKRQRRKLRYGYSDRNRGECARDAPERHATERTKLDKIEYERCGVTCDRARARTRGARETKQNHAYRDFYSAAYGEVARRRARFSRALKRGGSHPEQRRVHNRGGFGAKKRYGERSAPRRKRRIQKRDDIAGEYNVKRRAERRKNQREAGYEADFSVRYGGGFRSRDLRQKRHRERIRYSYGQVYERVHRAEKPVTCRRFGGAQPARRENIYHGQAVRNTGKRHDERAESYRNGRQNYRFCDRFYFGFAGYAARVLLFIRGFIIYSVAVDRDVGCGFERARSE